MKEKKAKGVDASQFMITLEAEVKRCLWLARVFNR